MARDADPLSRGLSPDPLAAKRLSDKSAEAAILLFPKLLTYIKASIQEFGQIDVARGKALDELAHFVRERVRRGQTAQLTFICTHNSRRSHMAQIWAQTAAAYYQIPHIQTFSGGSEATSFNPRAAAALRRAGFRVDQTTEGVNPICHVRFREDAPVIIAFSKIYNQPPNPATDYCAVMTCTQADASCPADMGAATRIALAYQDPKSADGTVGESAHYDARCRQISREMLNLFARAKQGLAS